MLRITEQRDRLFRWNVMSIPSFHLNVTGDYGPTVTLPETLLGRMAVVLNNNPPAKPEVNSHLSFTRIFSLLSLYGFSSTSFGGLIG